MEICEVNLHTNGGQEYLENAVKYPIDERRVLAKGFGVTTHDPDIAVMQFSKTARFYNNENKTPLFHYVLSFTKKTASSAEQAMELSEKIFKPITDDHLALIGIHNKKRGDSEYHAHVAISPTNYINGNMMYADNSTLFPIAQRMADATGQECRLVVKPEDKQKKEFHKVFKPHVK